MRSCRSISYFIFQIIAVMGNYARIYELFFVVPIAYILRKELLSSGFREILCFYELGDGKLKGEIMVSFSFYPNHFYGCKPYLLQNRGCLGCPKVPFMTNVKKPTGIAEKDSITNKASVVQDFWSSSTYEMDNSAAQSQLSASSVSMSNPNLDGHCSSGSNPPEFVNRGLLLWNQTRQQWNGDKGSSHRKKAREPAISWNATYDNLLGSNKPFPKSIPLPEMVKFLVDVWEEEGEDVLYHGVSKYQTCEDSDVFLSLGRRVDVYFPSCKRSRVSAPFVFSEQLSKKQQTTIDVLPDECLFEILRRVSGGQEKSSCASVSKRWLMLLSTIHRNEQKKAQDFDKSGGSLTRCLKGKKATNIRLAAIGVGSGNLGGLGELSILGNSSSKVSDFGLKAIARGCPSLTSLTLWNLSSIKDEGVTEIANECRLLEKVEISQCPAISNKSLMAIASNCPHLTSLSIESCSNIGNEGLQAIGKSCPNLKSISIKNCPLVGDQVVVSLVTSASSSLMKLKLHGLTIGDMSLAVIGHYGLALTDLVLSDLHTVTEKGVWVMGSGQGLQKLKSIVIVNCNGVTDLGLEALGRGCPNLKQISVKKSSLLSDNGIVAFAKVTVSVESVILEECHTVTQLGIFGLLVSCGSLKTLSLTKCLGIQDLPMIIPSGLSPCKSLISLSICNCPGFGNFSLALMGRLCHNLQEIVLTGLHGIKDSGLASLIKNCESGLTKIDLSGCVNLTDKIVSDISMVHGETLEVLNLDGCRSITDASVVTVAQNCFSLKELDVSKSAITDYSVAALACAEHSNLQVLSISGCQVSNKSLPFLKKLGARLIGLNIMQCRGVSSSAVGLLGEQIWNCDILV
ncbi:hypothetical protein SSX86_023745 [Deinandra increscens subsp. villosa]|uniref:F-box domain-containing protein n=1 Tax=Deinandra increscens subsp. villosa TaxID=3103831 RepID=A0AAP0CLF4_9ASTR